MGNACVKHEQAVSQEFSNNPRLTETIKLPKNS